MLPKFLQTFDLCFMPFKSEPNMIDHHMLYDYLSAGKPVVTTTKSTHTRLAKLTYHFGTVKQFGNDEQFLKLMSAALKEKGVKKLLGARQKIAKENDWEKRVAQLEKIMKKTVKGQ